MSAARRWGWRLLWQVAITAAFAAIALRAFDPGALRDAAAGVAWRWAPPALLLFTAAKYIDSWRWRYLLRGVGPPPQRALFGAFLIGNMVNNLLPLRAGDVAKVQVLTNRYGTSRAGLAASVFVVEATLDGVVFVLFLLAAVALWDPGDLPARGIAVLVLAAAAAFALALALTRGGPGGALLRLVPRRWRGRVRLLIGGAADGLHALGAWRRTAGAVALSVPAWLVEAGMFALFGRAFGLDLPYPTYVATMVAANLAVSVPVALWNFGPYEALVVGVLVAAGVDDTAALSYAVTVHLSTNLWIEATGLVAFWALRVSPRDVFALGGGRVVPTRGEAVEPPPPRLR